PIRSNYPNRGRALAEKLGKSIEAPPSAANGSPSLPPALTYHRTATRSFELAYWKMIDHLAEGRYVNKVNADCVLDTVTQSLITHPERDLEPLGDYLIDYYRRKIVA